MKQITKHLAIIGTMLAASNAVGYAMDTEDTEFKPFVGADCLQAWMPAKKAVGAKDAITTFSAGGVTDTIDARSTFRPGFSGGTFYAGFKFIERFGLELGWDLTFASRTRAVPAPTSSPIAGGYNYASKVRREGYHADLMGFFPIDCSWELFGTIGWGAVKAKIIGQSLVANNAANQAVLDAGTSLPLKGKKSSVLRLGVGVNHMFTKVFGLRAKLGWEGTRALRVAYTDNTSAKIFKNSVTLAAGVFISWQ